MKNKKGFTLIELLVALAIIGLLTTMGMVAMKNAREKARDARRKGDLKQVQTALGVYYNGTGNADYTVQGTFVCLSAAANLSTALTGGVDPIMKTLPSDPMTTRDSVVNGCYAYRGDAQNYKLIMFLENETEAMTNDGGVIANRFEIYTPGAQSWQP